MKRKALFLTAVALGALIPLCLAQNIETTSVAPVMLATPFARWQELGTITGSQAYPGVGDRDYPTVSAITDANSFTWTLPNYARKVQMSFQTSADADSTTIVLMGFADAYSLDTTLGLTLNDDAVYLGQLVLTGGKQVGKHSNVYVDTIVGTDGIAAFSVLDSAADRRCVVEFNTRGYKKIIGVATTLQASSTLYCEGRVAP